MLFVPPNGIQAMELVGISTTTTMGAFRSVRIIVAMCNTV